MMGLYRQRNFFIRETYSLHKYIYDQVPTPLLITINRHVTKQETLAFMEHLTPPTESSLCSGVSSNGCVRRFAEKLEVFPFEDSGDI